MTNDIKILVVEDEIIIADNISYALSNLGYEVLEPAITYSEAIESIELYHPDIAIIDIQLSGNKTGIDLATTINERFQIPFIFLTSNSDKSTLKSALMVNPHSFLVKPFNDKELYASVELAIRNFSGNKVDITDENLILNDSIFVKDKQRLNRIKFEDILYLQSDNVYVDIYCRDNTKVTARAKLSDFETKLKDNFKRIHRSFIINMEYIAGIENGYVIINQSEIPASKKYLPELINIINKV